MGKDRSIFGRDLELFQFDRKLIESKIQEYGASSFYSSNKETIDEQVNALKSGPASFDKDAIMDWIKKNFDAIVLLDKRDFVQNSDNEDIKKAEKETKDIRNAMNDWISLCAENRKLLFKENGDMVFFGYEEPGSPKEKYDILVDKFLTIKVHKTYEPDRKELGKFADELKAATKSTLHDSAEYKKIITLLNEFKDGIDFSKAPGERAQEWRALAGNQKHALSLHMLKDALDEYINHKAADGVKAKDFKKLAAVEKLNQFVGNRLKEMNCGYPITFNKTYYAAPTVTYDEELKSLHANKINDTNLQERVEKNIGNELKDAEFAKEIQNYSSCMDRIMMQKQLNLINKKTNYTREDLDKEIDSMQKQRNEVLTTIIPAGVQVEKTRILVEDVHNYAVTAKKGDLDSPSRENFTKIADAVKAVKQFPKDSVKGLRDKLSVDIFKMAFKLQDKVNHPEGFVNQGEFAGIKKDVEELFEHGNKLEAAKAQKEHEENKAVKKDVKARGI